MRTLLLLTLAACGFHSPASTAVEVDSGGATDGAMTIDAMSPDGPAAAACAGYMSLALDPSPSLYLVVTTPTLSFKSAELSCEKAQGHLVILNDEAEAAAVAAAVAVVAISWVGFSDLKNENTWIDVAGQPSSYVAVSAHWAVNEPSTADTDNCASLISVAGVASLDAVNCGNKDGGGEGSEKHGYVCECRDGNQGNPNNFKRSGSE